MINFIGMHVFSLTVMFLPSAVCETIGVVVCGTIFSLSTRNAGIYEYVTPESRISSASTSLIFIFNLSTPISVLVLSDSMFYWYLYLASESFYIYILMYYAY